MTNHQDRAAWLERRRESIGASESAGILGVSPWSSPLSVWASKVLDPEPDEPSEPMIWGTLLEPTILAEYSRRRGVDVAHHDQSVSIRHPRFVATRMSCTPDGIAADGGLVEAKAVNAYALGDWEDGAPLYYRVQLQHQLAVTGRDHGTLVALIGGQKLVWHDEERSAEFIETLEDACARFWRDFVLPGIQPPATATPGDIRALERMHPSDSGETIDLPAGFAELDARLDEIREIIKPLEAEEKDIKARLKAAIGGATFGVIPGVDGRWAWKSQDRKEYTVAASTIRVLRRLKK